MTRAALSFMLVLVLWGRGCAGFGDDATTSKSCVLPTKQVGAFLKNDVCATFSWFGTGNTEWALSGMKGIDGRSCLDTTQTNVGEAYKIEVWRHCQAHFFGTCHCHNEGHWQYGGTGGCKSGTAVRAWDYEFSGNTFATSWENHYDMCEASQNDAHFRFSQWGYDISLPYRITDPKSVPPRSDRRQCDLLSIQRAWTAGRVTEQHYCWKPRVFKISPQYVQPHDSRFWFSKGALPANFKQMQDSHCYEWSNDADNALEMCHPATTLGACSKINYERSCYIQPSSQFFTVAFFPWALRKTTQTSPSASSDNGLRDSGPALYSQDGLMAHLTTATPLTFKTGSVSACDVCTDTILSVSEEATCDPERHYLQPLHKLTAVQLKITAATEDTWSHWLYRALGKLPRPGGGTTDEGEADGQPPKTVKFILDAINPVKSEAGAAKNVSEFISTLEPVYNTDRHTLQLNRICDKQRTLGCYSWYDSQSFNPCLEGGPAKQQFINTCHSTQKWLETSDMYQKWKARELTHGSRQDEDRREVGRDLMALFVPQMEGFHSQYSLTLQIFTDSTCTIPYQVYTDAAATGTLPETDSTPTSTPVEGNGIHYMPATHPSFKLTPVSRASGEASELYCTCPANATHLYGAVSSAPALMHECELCAGNAYRAIIPGTVAQQCGATKYACRSCATQGAHFIRRKRNEGDIGGCVECPPGHIANQERELGDYWTRLRETHLLTLEEMRDLSSMRYGVEWPTVSVQALLREHQLFAGSLANTFSHIHGTRLEGGGWTCHICAFGFKFVARQCLPLRLLHMRWSAAVGSQAAGWSLETLPVGVVIGGSQPPLGDEVTVNARRDVTDNVPNGKYLDSTALANATFVQHDCPSGGHVNGYFRHMCGQPDTKVWVTVTQALVVQPGLTLSGYPPPGEQLLFDTATKTFAKARYDRVDGEGLPTPFAGTHPYLDVPGPNGAQFDYRLELERGGADLACWRCTDGKYNAGCASTGEGSFGTCQACRTTPVANHFLRHDLAMGCTGWDEAAVFVDKDYEDAPCTGLEVSGGDDGRRFRLCVGFCGGYSQFKWWRPVVGDSDIDTGEIPFSQICQRAAIEASTAGSECQHPDTDELFGIATNFEECSDTIPYCPVGFYVDAACAGSQLVAGRGQLRQFEPACCKRCQQACAVNERRRADWAQCPGDTVVDTQARCGAGCDVNYYFDMESQQCKMCESCLEGLRV